MAHTAFEDENMNGFTFRNVALSRAEFTDVNLSGANFRNVNLSGATLRDVNLSHVTIDEACVEGLVIWGVEIRPIIEAELARRRAEKEQAG